MMEVLADNDNKTTPCYRLSHLTPEPKLEDQKPITELTDWGLSAEELNCLYGYSESMDFDPFASFVDQRFDQDLDIPDSISPSFPPLQISPQVFTPQQLNSYPPTFMSSFRLSDLPVTASTPKTSHRVNFPSSSTFSQHHDERKVYWGAADTSADTSANTHFSPFDSMEHIWAPYSICKPDPQLETADYKPRRLFHSSASPTVRVKPYSRPLKHTLSSAGHSECSSTDTATSPNLSCTSTDTATSPNLSCTSTDTATSPNLSCSSTDTATSPNLSCSSTDTATSPNLSPERNISNPFCSPGLAHYSSYCFPGQTNDNLHFSSDRTISNPPYSPNQTPNYNSNFAPEPAHFNPHQPGFPQPPVFNPPLGLDDLRNHLVCCVNLLDQFKHVSSMLNGQFH